jgi:hypothetical protein
MGHSFSKRSLAVPSHSPTRTGWAPRCDWIEFEALPDRFLSIARIHANELAGRKPQAQLGGCSPLREVGHTWQPVEFQAGHVPQATDHTVEQSPQQSWAGFFEACPSIASSKRESGESGEVDDCVVTQVVALGKPRYHSG